VQGAAISIALVTLPFAVCKLHPAQALPNSRPSEMLLLFHSEGSDAMAASALALSIA
jgi:hypothetical protein